MRNISFLFGAAAMMMGIGCETGGARRVTVADDSAVFVAAMTQLKSSGETPQFVDPRPASLDSFGVRSSTTPAVASPRAIVEARTRILRRLGISPTPFISTGPCAGVFVPDRRRKAGCPSTAVTAADVSAVTRRGKYWVMGVAVRSLAPMGSATVSRFYVFERSGRAWTLSRVERGLSID